MGNLNLPFEVVNREGDFANDDLYKFDSKMRMGYNYLHCDLQVIAV